MANERQKAHPEFFMFIHRPRGKGTTARPLRARLQFRLTTILILTTVFGVWLGVKLHDARRHKDAVESLRGLGAEVNMQTGASSLFARLFQSHSGGFVSMVRLQNPNARDADLACLRAIPEIESLALEDIPVTDRLFGWLRGASRLSSLSVYSGGEITDAGLAGLATHTDLMTVGICPASRITDRGLAHLRSLPELRSLCISPAPLVTDEALAHLQSLTKLKSLDLSGTKITGDGLRHLRVLTNLERLFLSDTSVSDAGLRHLQGLGKLQWLGLVRTRVSGEGLSALANCKKLTTVFLSWNHDLDDDGLQHAADIGSLRHLQAFETSVTAGGVKRLRVVAPLIKVGVGRLGVKSCD
jgi:hypothetical protein